MKSLPFCSPSVRNAPLFPPYPNTGTLQVNGIPAALLGDSSAPVMFSSGREQVAGGISHSWTSFTYETPRGFPSSSRGGGTSVNDGDGIGVSSSNGGTGGGGNGDCNGISGGNNLSGCRPA